MKKNRSMLCLLACLLLIAVMPVQALAGSDFSEKECSLELHYIVKAFKPMTDVSFAVYRVADFTNGLTFEPTSAFRSAGVEFNGIMENDTWMDVASLLSTFISANEIKPDSEALTDENGTAEFSQLNYGLYLVVGSTKEVGGTYYTPTPFLLCLPDLQRGEWVYDVTSNVKHTEETPEPLETTDHKVLIVWNDSNAVDKRPESVTVNLTKNGKIVDTKTLTSNDNWRCTWTDLPVNDENGTPIKWSVLENSVDGYTISSEEQGITTVITNTKPAPVNPSKPSDPALPQTGQEWMPVLILAIIGTLFIVAGVARKKSKAE